MKHILKSTIIVLLSLLTAGCGIYYPKCVDIPLIQEKGELQLEGAVLPPDNRYDVPALRASIAYGITDHMAAAASTDPLRCYSQIMAGSYFPQDGKFIWEIYGGLGYGYGQHYVDHDPGLSSYGKYTIVFLQTDGGWHNLTRFMNIDLAFSIKAGLFHNNLSIGEGTEYYSDTIDGHAYGYYYTRQHSAIENRLLIEPTAEVRFGWPDFKFNMKAGLSYLIGSEYSWRPSLGIGFGMSYRFKTNRKTK